MNPGDFCQNRSNEGYALTKERSYERGSTIPGKHPSDLLLAQNGINAMAVPGGNGPVRPE